MYGVNTLRARTRQIRDVYKKHKLKTMKKPASAVKEQVEDQGVTRPNTPLNKAVNRIKHRTKVHKLLAKAFHKDTEENEAIAAFLQSRRFLLSDGTHITEVMRPEWGGGPLVTALQKYGHIIMTVGHYEGMTMEKVMEVDPGHVITLYNTGGIRKGPCNTAITELANAYTSELMCRWAGEYKEDFDIRQWDKEEEKTGEG